MDGELTLSFFNIINCALLAYLGVDSLVRILAKKKYLLLDSKGLDLYILLGWAYAENRVNIRRNPKNWV